jgi:hypothetical protein
VLREPLGTRGTDWHRVSPCRIVGVVHGTTECCLARMFPTFPPNARNSCVAPDCHHSPTPSPSTHLCEKRSLPLTPRQGPSSPPEVVPALRLPVRVALIDRPDSGSTDALWFVEIPQARLGSRQRSLTKPQLDINHSRRARRSALIVANPRGARPHRTAPAACFEVTAAAWHLLASLPGWSLYTYIFIQFAGEIS